MSEANSKKGSRDKRDRLTFDVGGLRDRLRVFAIEPNQSLASIVRMALIEWLSDRESQKSEKPTEIDKNDISINDND
ncbi:hypothetical protein QUB63_22525 [Microcoleus sp. ARI1-B5]|uniref:hypothetical protein n=1 Tax=unclassified Microcoleus TaxID=2642155 RepID=UPI002FD26BF3